MAESTVRLANGQRWTAQQFLDHYFEPTGSGMPTPVTDHPIPVDVDRSWYMDEGPGRYYHPGMFSIISQITDNRNLAPGTYDLLDFVPARNERDPSLTATISNYTTDVRAADYPLRAFVFGNESARIFGQVEVNPDGSKTFKQIEIRPLDTNFDFEHGSWLGNPVLETAREIARRTYDPENLGVSYGIQYRGPGPDRGSGRLYDPFTDSQLNAALHKEFVYPGSGPPGLLPSITGKAPVPYSQEHLQYLDQVNVDNPQTPSSPQTGGASDISSIQPVRSLMRVDGNNSPASGFGPSAPTAQFALPESLKSTSGIANWIAALAGVAPQNPTQAAPSPPDDQLRGFYVDDPLRPWFSQRPR